MTDPSATEHAHDPEKRRRLIAAAAAAFARIGFAETNVDVIAHDAGVAKGTVYLYFQNKRALFLAVLSELQRRLADGVLKERAASEERLRAFVRRQLLLADEEPELFRCYTSALFGVNRDFQDAALQVFTGRSNGSACCCATGRRHDDAQAGADPRGQHPLDRAGARDH